MSKTHDRGRLDWLVELAGAVAAGIAAAFIAAKLSPVNNPAIFGAGSGAFLAAYAVMRMVPAEVRQLALPPFDPVAIEGELLLDQLLAVHLDDELLLDQPLIEAATAEVAELLLDDPLPAPTRDSRVVQLFADGGMPTAGQMRNRIDRHLAESGRTGQSDDASDALSEALAELRRSLRQA